jgi:hypothetical protein
MFVAGEKRYTEWTLLVFNEHHVNNNLFVSCYVSAKTCLTNAKLYDAVVTLPEPVYEKSSGFYQQEKFPRFAIVLRYIHK